MIPEYIVLDIENNSTKRYKRDAGHFLYDDIVAYSLKNKTEQKTQYIYPEKIKDLEIDEDLIVGFNLKHDLLFLWDLPGIQKFLRRGGKIWDCQLAHYILNNMQTKYPSLRDVAVNQYNCLERKKGLDDLLFNKQKRLDEIKIELKINKDNIDLLTEKDILESYQQVSDLPKDVVIDDVDQDVKDTEKVFLQQYKECKERGILPLVEIQMGALLFTIETEFNGFKLDLNTLNQNMKELEDEITINEKVINNVVKKFYNIPGKEFNYKSGKDLATLFFGGTYKTKTKVLVGKYKNGKDKYQTIETTSRINGLGLKPLDEWKTPKGNVSIDESVLEHLIKLIDDIDSFQYKNQKEVRMICEVLLKLRGLNKEYSTYFKAIKELVVERTGCLHSKYHHCSTVTMRLSSSDCNLQNIPKANISKAKQHFVTRYL